MAYRYGMKTIANVNHVLSSATMSSLVRQNARAGRADRPHHLQRRDEAFLLNTFGGTT
ncbi:MAG: hypothetical protein AAGH60_13945 [Pseudomonadota bacterium]